MFSDADVINMCIFVDAFLHEFCMESRRPRDERYLGFLTFIIIILRKQNS